MIIKVTYLSQTHLYNKSINYVGLNQFVAKAFKQLPKSYSFIYQSSDHQITYIESDEDLIGLKYCCSATNDFIIKISIIKNRSAEDSELQEVTKSIITLNLIELGQKAIKKLQEQTVEQQVGNYLSSTFEILAEKAVNQQQNMIIHQSVELFLQKLMSKTAKRQAQNQFCILKPKPSRKRVVRFSPQRPVQQKIQKKSLQSLINERIMQIVPKIVENVFSQFQKRLKSKCINCIKKQEQLQNAINQQIQKRLRVFQANNPEN